MSERLVDENVVVVAVGVAAVAERAVVLAAGQLLQCYDAEPGGADVAAVDNNSAVAYDNEPVGWSGIEMVLGVEDGEQLGLCRDADVEDRKWSPGVASSDGGSWKAWLVRIAVRCSS